MNQIRWAWLCAGTLALVLAPLSSAQQREAPLELAPNELRAALQASKAVFAAQAAERREAERAGLADLEGEFRLLHRAIRDAAGDQGRGRVRAASAVPPGAPSAASVEVDERLAKAQRELDGIQARTRGIEAKIERLKSPRQRAVARAAVSRLHALRGDAEAALAAPTEERLQRLGDLADRLAPSTTAQTSSTRPLVPLPTETLAPERRKKNIQLRRYEPDR